MNICANKSVDSSPEIKWLKMIDLKYVLNLHILHYIDEENDFQRNDHNGLQEYRLLQNVRKVLDQPLL